ncbi:hypothetical protein BWR59_02060 [Pseudomonas sp. Bc-h]|jgi:hypothetical protein|uniref:hypothetical protein n=1 Tax=Pseudomonas sp. Bc-h TaxID=1943632 RepID=UPI0009DA3A51|nr:hypothetical protein [Pseudomonas sp. Bc-h]OQR37901.1 hypothetical protein BWR59_02060 [Pseudomonas sp. Bc-h]
MTSLKSRVLRKGVCRINLFTQNELAPPSLAIPSAIPDYDGLLPIEVLGEDLEISLPWWDGVEEDMRLQIAWKAFDPDDPNDPGDLDLIGTRHDVTDAEAADTSTVFKLYVPKALLVHGVYIIRVRARSFPGGVNDWTTRHTVRVDTEEPGGGALPLLTFPAQVIDSKKIVDADIVDGELLVQLAHYEGIARGDSIQLWINLRPCGTEELTIDPDPGEGFIRLAYLEAELEEIGNGPASFFYKVTDKAGNFAGSNSLIYDIQLHTTPTVIPAPSVPQADPDLLDEAEARSGTGVGITKFDLALVGDEIMVHWGSQTSAKYALTAADLGNDPFITIQLAYSLVVAETELGTVDVTFEVFRNGVSIGMSDVNTVNVDLRIPGGPDPDPETPINENLKPLIARSDSAGDPPPPGEDNVIPPQDFTKDARVIIPWLAVDDSDIYQVNDIIKVTWGTQTTSTITRTIVQQDLDDAIDLVLPVPTATVQAQGAGVDIPVGYTITRPSVALPDGNSAIAPNTPVTVIGPNELPGGGTIDAPVFTVLNEDDAIGQDQLIGPVGGRYNPVQTRIDYANVAAGDTVQLFFSGWDRLTGGSEVVGARYTTVYTLTAADIAAGTYTFNVSAQYHIAVCSRGHVEAYVAIQNSKGSTTSPTASAYCDVKRPTDPDCSGYVP